jgi:methyltransferase-like protein
MELMAKTLQDPDAPYGKLMTREADMLRDAPDAYLYHEHLEQDNRPLYFHQFASQCAEAGLDYVAEARLLNHAGPLMSGIIRGALEQLPAEAVEREQYLDFLQNRTFRRSLVSHKGLAQKVTPSPHRISQLHLECNVRPVTGGTDKLPPGARQFTNREGQKITTNNPWITTVLQCLFEVWPRSMVFSELAARVKGVLSHSSEQQVRAQVAQMDDSAGNNALTAVVMQCYLAKLVELHLNPPRFRIDPGPRPVAFPLARIQAADGLDRVSTLRHRTVLIGEFERLLLPMLDGTRGTGELANEALAAVQRGAFAIEKKGRKLTDAGEARAVMEESVPIALNRLAQSALLVE